MASKPIGGVMPRDSMKPVLSRITLDGHCEGRPEPFDSARAREIKAACELDQSTHWTHQVAGRMTQGEWAFVFSVRKAIPSRGSSFFDSFRAILNGDVDGFQDGGAKE